MGGGYKEVKTPGAGDGTEKGLVSTGCECLENTSDLLFWSILT